MTLERFETWGEAYDVCRERDTPLDVFIEATGEAATVFPSGTYRLKPMAPKETIENNGRNNAPGCSPARIRVWRDNRICFERSEPCEP